MSAESGSPVVVDGELERLMDRLRPHVYECDCAFCANFFFVRASLMEYKTKDTRRLDWLEEKGVESVYLRNAGQFNPASQSLRSAIDSAMRERPQ